MTRLEELLQIIPEKIEHSILKTEWEDSNPVTRWSDYKATFVLRMEKKDGKFSATYVHTGFEGEIQILPMTTEELNDYLEYGGVLEYHDSYRTTLEEALEELLCWLKKDGLLNKEAK